MNRTGIFGKSAANPTQMCPSLAFGLSVGHPAGYPRISKVKVHVDSLKKPVHGSLFVILVSVWSHDFRFSKPNRMNSTHTRFHSECHFLGFLANHWNDSVIIRDSGSQASPRPTCSAPSLPLARPTSYVGRTMGGRCPRRVFSSLKGLAFRASRHLTRTAKKIPGVSDFP